jgi:hypothetical protein
MRIRKKWCLLPGSKLKSGKSVDCYPVAAIKFFIALLPFDQSVFQISALRNSEYPLVVNRIISIAQALSLPA